MNKQNVKISKTERKQEKKHAETLRNGSISNNNVQQQQHHHTTG